MAELSLTCRDQLGAEDLPRLSAVLRAVPGVESVGLDAASGRLRLSGKGHLPLLGVLEAGYRAGYELEPALDPWLFPNLDRRDRQCLARFRWALVLTLPLLAMDFLAPRGPTILVLAAVFHLLLFMIPGRRIFARALRQLRQRQMGADLMLSLALLLTSLATPLAFFGGTAPWSSLVGLVLTVMTLAAWLECRILNQLPLPPRARREDPGRSEAMISALSQGPAAQVLIGGAGRWMVRLLPALALVWGLLVMLPPFHPGHAIALRGMAALLLTVNLRGLALALPAALLVAQMSAARRGLWFRRTRDIVDLHRARALIFDRIGFLTRGSAKVENFQVFGSESQEQLLSLVAGALTEAGHPYLRALSCFAGKRVDNAPRALSMIRRPGGGIKAEIAGRVLLIGHPWFLDGEGIDLSKAEAALAESAKAALTPLLLAVDGKLAGLFRIQDEPRPESPSLVRRLKGFGLELHLLTGETEAVARSAAEAAGVPAWRAGMSAESRAGALRELDAKEGPVAAIGTGSHDAPLMAAAPFAIAMGQGLGRMQSPVLNIETEQPSAVLDAFLFSRTVTRIMHQNLALVCGLALLGLLLAASSILGPVGVALLHAISMLLVWLNSLRLSAYRFECGNEAGR